jgi:peptide deformylase
MVDYIEASYYDEADKYDIRVGVAVAANQVGLDKSVIYIHANDINDNEFKYLLANPKIVSHSQGKSYLPDGEGCLSVDDEHKGIIPRYSKIVVKGIDLLNNNKEVKIEADGMLAIIMQHEIDHLYGTLFYDYINKEDPFYINPE